MLSLSESLLGCVKRVANHPGFTDGLDVPIPAGTQRKEEVVLQGKGMPDKKGGFGDFIALIDVKVSETERESLKAHAMDLQSLFKKDSI